MATDSLDVGARRVGCLAGPTPWPSGAGCLISAVLGWFALLILVPTAGTVAAGRRRRAAAVLEVAGLGRVRTAFGLTLGITALATVVNTVFGSRGAGPGPAAVLGQALVDGMVDLPFAVSPIIAGLMLIISLGRRAGWDAG